MRTFLQVLLLAYHLLPDPEQFIRSKNKKKFETFVKTKSILLPEGRKIYIYMSPDYPHAKFIVWIDSDGEVMFINIDMKRKCIGLSLPLHLKITIKKPLKIGHVFPPTRTNGMNSYGRHCSHGDSCLSCSYDTSFINEIDDDDSHEYSSYGFPCDGTPLGTIPPNTTKFFLTINWNYSKYPSRCISNPCDESELFCSECLEKITFENQRLGTIKILEESWKYCSKNEACEELPASAGAGEETGALYFLVKTLTLRRICKPNSRKFPEKYEVVEPFAQAVIAFL